MMLKFRRTVCPRRGNSGMGESGRFELRKRRPWFCPLDINILSDGDVGYL